MTDEILENRMEEERWMIGIASCYKTANKDTIKKCRWKKSEWFKRKFKNWTNKGIWIILRNQSAKKKCKKCNWRLMTLRRNDDELYHVRK